MKENPTERMWRTLVRVSSTKPVLSPLNYPKGFYLIIPGWNCRKPVYVFKQSIPPSIYNDMEVGKRYHVRCNIGSEKEEDLCFDRWEKE